MTVDTELKMKTDNQVIAEFMELPKVKIGRWHINGHSYLTSQLQYPNSWDWLMPVVEKIYKTDYPLPQTKVSDIQGALTTAKIEAVYRGVIEFLHWYNANKS